MGGIINILDGTNLSQLNVTGITTVAAGSAAAPSISPTGDSNTGIFFPAADTIAFGEGGSEAARIDSSGRFGLGTASPSTSLHVQGANTVGKGQFIVSSASAGQEARMTFIDGSDDIAEISTDGNNLYFLNETATGAFLWYTGGSERARIDSSGRFGIGSTLAGNANNRTLIRSDSASAISNVLLLNNGPADNNAGQGVRINLSGVSEANSNIRHAYIESGIQTSGNDHYIAFGTNAAFATPQEAVRIDSSRRLLVGTTSVSGANYSAKLALSTNSGTTRWEVGPYSTSTAFIITADTTNGVYLPSTSATSWSSASDERIKTDLEPITDGLAKVASLRAVTGRYISDKEEPRKAFLIAQDVLEVLPEAVDISNPERYGLAYTEVIPLLVSALKESKERIEQLEAKVAALEAQ